MRKTPSKDDALRWLYQFTVLGIGPLGGDHWRGWRLAGRVLVSPDGDRISPERLRGLLWCGKHKSHSPQGGIREQSARRNVTQISGGRALKVLAAIDGADINSNHL